MTATTASLLDELIALHARRKLAKNISTVLMTGFWFCYGCDQMTEREEGEHGQPAHCERCGSCRIEYHKPAWEQTR